MLLEFSKVSKSFGDHTLFTNISFRIDEGHKVALVGANGAGKSTMLKMIAGIEESDAGTITISKGRNVAYLPQEVDLNSDMDGLSYIQDSAEGPFQEHMIYAILSGLGIDQNKLSQPLNSMSGGQQTKILLTKLLLEKSNILLLDEPTNNLDISSILWLEKYLSTVKKALLVVSHDIYFLNKVADRFIEIDKQAMTINTNRGSYIDYIERKIKEDARQLGEYKRQTKQLDNLREKIKDTKDSFDSTQSKVQNKDNDKIARGARADTASSSMKEVRKLEKQLSRIDRIDKPFDEEEFSMAMHPKNTEDSDIELEDVMTGYTDFPVGPVDLNIPYGHRVCLIGPNGSGKSTLLKTITKDLKAEKGSVKIGEGVVFGDMMQRHERADRDKTVSELFAQETRASNEKIFHMLSKYGIPQHLAEHKVGALSAGTRARILFAIFAVLGVNVLVLDEPTNHLDMEAIEALVRLLEEYTGTVILVSHNRWFVEKIKVDKWYEVSAGEISEIEDFTSHIKNSARQAESMLKKLARNL